MDSSTFHTGSLKGQFRQLINTFVIEQTNEEPDWDNLKIIHSWGATGGGERHGLYYEFCQSNRIGYYNFITTQQAFGKCNKFEEACKKELAEYSNSTGNHDDILIDEAQDFPPAFLRICFEMLTSEKRLVYAYDDLQNLSSQSLPSPEEILAINLMALQTSDSI
ncbi:MAG TPA: hypothetical protein VLS94_00640 [Fusibacter sp.]|nr:hypothetical protein [Fusibacter sp.]